MPFGSNRTHCAAGGGGSDRGNITSLLTVSMLSLLPLSCLTVLVTAVSIFSVSFSVISVFLFSSESGLVLAADHSLSFFSLSGKYQLNLKAIEGHIELFIS